MAWTSPMTFAANQILTAAQLNTHLRDNMLETEVAKATTAGATFVTRTPGEIVERFPDTTRTGAAETATDKSYTDLASAGPARTVTTGSKAWVMLYAGVDNDTANQACYMSYEVSGATTIAANDAWALEMRRDAVTIVHRASAVNLVDNLTPGLNTFTAKYRVTNGTGRWRDRFIAVWPL